MRLTGEGDDIKYHLAFSSVSGHAKIMSECANVDRGGERDSCGPKFYNRYEDAEKTIFNSSKACVTETPIYAPRQTIFRG